MPAKLLDYATHILSINGNSNGIRDQIGTHIGSAVQPSLGGSSAKA
jgi:hypothetical protein